MANSTAVKGQMTHTPSFWQKKNKGVFQVTQLVSKGGGSDLESGCAAVPGATYLPPPTLQESRSLLPRQARKASEKGWNLETSIENDRIITRALEKGGCEW